MCPSKSKVLNCYECKKDFHIECIDLQIDTYNVIVESANAGSRWHCSTCLATPSSKSITSLQQNIEDFKELIRNDLKSVTVNFENQLTSFKQTMMNTYQSCQESTSKISDSLTTYASVVTKNLEKQHKTAESVVEIKKDVQSLSTNVQNEKLEQSELKLREHKKNNVIIFKMPESEEKCPTEAYKEDFINTMKAIDPKNELKKEDVVDLYRLPSAIDANARPIIVRLKSTEKRNNIVKLHS